MSIVNVMSLREILEDAEALLVLDALKAAYSMESIQRRKQMQQRLERGELGRALAVLQEHGLVHRTETGWSVAPERMKIAYQLVRAAHDQSEGARDVLGWTGLSRPRTWLDIGTGSGGLLRWAKRLGMVESPVGCDVDAEAIALAQIAPGGEGCRFVAAPGHALPVESNSCDLVSSIGCLGYLQIHASLDEIRRVTAPRGRLLLEFHGWGYYLELATKYLLKGQIPVYATQCLVEGLRVLVGFSQTPNTREGWIRYELPISAGWLKRQLERRGFRVSRIEVKKRRGPFPVTLRLLAARA